MRLAVSFLTRLPGGRHPASTAELGQAVPWFPLVGVLVGGLGAAVMVGLSELTTPLLAAVGAVAVTAAATGALHEDGLADSADGLAGAADPDSRRRILDDSRLGTFGVLTLVLATVAKVAALAELSSWDAVTALVAAHCAARTGSVALLGLAPLAPGPGSGRSLAEAVSLPRLAAGIALGSGLSLAILLPGGALRAVVALGLVALLAAAVAAWARARIGGVTGDMIGAAEQLGEIAVLVVLAAR